MLGEGAGGLRVLFRGFSVHASSDVAEVARLLRPWILLLRGRVDSQRLTGGRVEPCDPTHRSIGGPGGRTRVPVNRLL